MQISEVGRVTTTGAAFVKCGICEETKTQLLSACFGNRKENYDSSMYVPEGKNPKVVCVDCVKTLSAALTKKK